MTNIEKAHYSPRFSASWEKTVSPGVRVLALDGGIRVNVAPANCTCLVENADRTQLEAVLERVSGETGVSLTAVYEGNTAKITAVGVQAHASTPDEGKNTPISQLWNFSGDPAGPVRAASGPGGSRKDGAAAARAFSLWG